MPRRPGLQPRLQPPTIPPVHLARDHPPAVVRALVRSGVWVEVRPGAYTDAPLTADPYASARARAVARVAAAVMQLETSVVVSHGSAALLWGLPAPTEAPVHLTQGTKPCRNARGLMRHSHQLSATDTTALSWIPLTTLTRTVVDCAASLRPSIALAVVDAALHAGLDRAACLDRLGMTPGRRGVVQARAVLELADDGSESPGESLARFALLAAGLPRPETQVRVETHLGTFWSDLGWPEWRLLAEYDGRGKYEAGGTAATAVLSEKRRQDAIEEAGFRVLRITREDLRSPEHLVARILHRAPPGAVRLPLTRRGALTGRPPVARARR